MVDDGRQGVTDLPVAFFLAPVEGLDAFYGAPAADQRLLAYDVIRFIVLPVVFVKW